MEQALEETANVLFAFFLEGQAIQPFLDRHDPDLGEAVASPLRQDVAVEPRPIEGARGEAGEGGGEILPLPTGGRPPPPGDRVLWWVSRAFTSPRRRPVSPQSTL